MKEHKTNNRNEIYKYATNKQILSLTDLLSVSGGAPKKSKIVVTLVKYDEETHKAQEVLSHYLDPLDAKLISWQVLTDSLTEHKDYKGSRREEGYQARILTVRRDPNKKRGYIIVLDQGEGKPTLQGAVTMKKKEISRWIALSELEMKKLALALLDYIRAWEIKQMLERRNQAF